MPFLGAHMSASGGLHKAVERISAIGGQALQVFTRNQRQWKAAPVTDHEAEAFRQAVQAWGYGHHMASHDSYLINLASPQPEIADKSRAALAEELARCGKLGIPLLVLHPGAHLGTGVADGLAKLTENLDAALEQAASLNKDTESVTVLLENTAGQGSSLGSSFEELAEVMTCSRHSARLGVCLDTCHAFAAGFDLRTDEGYAATFAAIAGTFGLERVRLFHVNDAKTSLGSRVDRHEHIGQGNIGLEAFRRLLNDARFVNLPMVLETPKDSGDGLEQDRVNLEMLHNLLGQAAGHVSP
ncbi:deoxyribonuclease IV [Desulfocurvibacter africanus]|uniref:deoxyribonuclease IV n=1 Tax=Desulfocurvibacter africanus TaxID=873 RepID=UPI000400778A|nr:deoxyribonuclease IV [Desulfocurvibacter africanus]